MATGTIGRIVRQTKRDLAEKVVGQALGLLGNDPDRNAKYLLKAIDHVASTDQQAVIRDFFHDWLGEGYPGREFLGRILKNTHPNVRQRYIARMLVSVLFDRKQILEHHEKWGDVEVPGLMLISPSMRCNYRCEGCYAGSYSRKDDMKPEVFDRLITEAENMGIDFFVVLGGEPFIYPHLLETIAKHNRSFFQIYTSGFFIDEKMAAKLVEFGNVAPQISVNGPAEFTDGSRGKGAFKTVMRAMDNLREAGCVFGFSSLVTRQNVDAICSEEWIDMLIDKGVLYGWLFLYMPVGKNPDMDLMPTPEQRDKVRQMMRNYRRTKPIIPLDFWSDGALTGGCIAGGRQYFHVNHRGDVEPCIFCHFSTHNIHECSLKDALRSPFFSSIRDKQPFSYNTLRPCPIIDHPKEMWNIIEQHGAKATHEGAEDTFTTFMPQMKEYAAKVANIMDDVWEKEDYHEWGPKWTVLCKVPEEKLEKRREEYQRAHFCACGMSKKKAE
jgi:MoaA/NifB/PqqE/SkfB family radical SAM enzyme